MAGYIMNLRQFVGHCPLIMCCAGVLLLNRQNEVLLEHRADNNLWGIPGGAMEPGESLEETVRREVFEETGLILGRLEFFNVYSGKEFYYQYPNGDEVFLVDYVYTCREYSGELITSSESKELCFFAPDNLPANIHPPNRLVLADFSKMKDFQE